MTQLYQSPVELVCAAARHMIAQGVPGAIVLPQGGVRCQYVAANGTRCALGGLLPADAVPDMDTERTFGDVVREVTGLVAKTDAWIAMCTAANSIQALHDTWADVVLTKSTLVPDAVGRRVSALDRHAPGWREAMSDDLPRFFALIGHKDPA